MSYVKRLAILALIGFGGLFAREAIARQNVVLPDLAPREVEITGDLNIVFPALRRQALVGFNPPPPVPDIPGSRLPFAEAYKQPSADLPPSPVLPPDPPEVSALAQRTPKDGLLSASVGRYLERDLSLKMTLGYSLVSYLVLTVNYRGSEGHDPFPNAAVGSGYDTFNAGISYSNRLGRVVLGTKAKGFTSRYHLFGLLADAGAQSLSGPERSFSGGELSLSIGSVPGSALAGKIEVRGGLSAVDTDVFDPSVRVDPSTKRTENFLSTDASLSVPIPDGYIALKALATTSGLDSGSFPGSTVQSGISQAEISYLYSRNLNIKAGVAVLGFRADAQANSDRSRSLAYLSPFAELSYTLSPSIRIFAGNQPVMDAGLMKSAFTQSPFIRDEPLLLPSLSSINAKSGVEYQSEFFTSTLQGGYKDQPFSRFAFQGLSPINGYSDAYPEFGYDSISMIFGKWDAAVMLKPGLQFGLDATYRKAELTDLKVDVPYFSPLVVGSFVSASFLDGQGLVTFSAKHESSRPIDLAGTKTTGGLMLFGVEGSYYITSDYGVTAGIRNLGKSPEFWHMYPFESSIVYFGAKYRW